MKKLGLIGIALFVAMMIAAPHVMALDAKFSGAYRARGFYNNNFTLSKDDASDAYMDMRLRVRTDFIISDRLSLTTRFDALDNKRWGDTDNPPGAGNDNIDWDRAFMNINAGEFGTFNVGRMGGGTWGTLFNDTDSERDRVKYTKRWDCFTLLAIYEKNAEGDGTSDYQLGNIWSDRDYDAYYLAGYYTMENWTVGLLTAWARNARNKDTGVLLENYKDEFAVFIPYFFGKIGNFGLQGEFRGNYGERKFEVGSDVDIKQYAFNLEGTYDFGVCKVELGWAFAKGQKTGDKQDIEGYGGGFGDDWEKLWILTGSTDDSTAQFLGGVGNLSATGGMGQNNGANLFYGGVDLPINEKINLRFVGGYAEADETPSGVSDKYGWEFDLVLNWQIMDNLKYTALGAYLKADDYYKDINEDITNRFEDSLFSAYHALTLSF
jgi:hypothetical protein